MTLKFNVPTEDIDLTEYGMPGEKLTVKGISISTKRKVDDLIRKKCAEFPQTDQNGRRMPNLTADARGEIAEAYTIEILYEFVRDCCIRYPGQDNPDSRLTDEEIDYFPPDLMWKVASVAQNIGTKQSPLGTSPSGTETGVAH